MNWMHLSCGHILIFAILEDICIYAVERTLTNNEKSHTGFI